MIEVNVLLFNVAFILKNIHMLTNNKHLLEDCTSPIPGFTDDISNILKKVGGNVVSKEEILYPLMFVIYWILMLLILFVALYIIVSILLYLRVNKIFFKFIRKKR
jgi:hypothetical protein